MAPLGESSHVIALRVASARARAVTRKWCSSAPLAARQLDARIHADKPTLALLHNAAAQLGGSTRSYHRVPRSARTIADLTGSDGVSTAHMARAPQLRRGLGSLASLP